MRQLKIILISRKELHITKTFMITLNWQNYKMRTYKWKTLERGPVGPHYAELLLYRYCESKFLKKSKYKSTGSTISDVAFNNKQYHKKLKPTITGKNN